MEPPTIEQIVDAMQSLGLTIGEANLGYQDACAIVRATRTAHIEAMAAKLVSAAPQAEHMTWYLSGMSAVYRILDVSGVEAEAIWEARKQLAQEEKA